MGFGLVFDSTRGMYTLVDRMGGEILRAGNGQFGVFGVGSSQSAHIADGTVAHVATDNTTYNASLFDALSVRMNSILDVLDSYGLTAAS